MKRLQDEASGGMVSREQVEAVIQDAFPRLKNALNDLFLNVKQALPDDARADFDIAFNKALPNYSKHLAAAVEALNAILDGGDKA